MFRYQHFATLTRNELHNLLVQKGYRPAEREAIQAEVKAYKEAQRVEKIRNAKHDSLWRDLIEPLSNEMRSVYNSLRYSKEAYPSRERKAALEAYQKVLSTLNRKLRSYWSAYVKTPRQLAVDKGLPNDGAHWTDWVPEKVKNAVVDAFAEIPPRFKAKAKVPFERKIPKATNSKKKAAMIRVIKTHIGREEQAIAMLTDLLKGESNDELEHHKEELQRLNTALKRLLALDDDEPVPHIWQELVAENPQ